MTQIVQPMPCPRCRHAAVVPHPESTAVIGLYDCPTCHQEWSARFHGDEVTLVLMDGSNDPKTVVTSLKQLNTGIIERLR